MAPALELGAAGGRPTATGFVNPTTGAEGAALATGTDFGAGVTGAAEGEVELVAATGAPAGDILIPGGNGNAPRDCCEPPATAGGFGCGKPDPGLGSVEAGWGVVGLLSGMRYS